MTKEAAVDKSVAADNNRDYLFDNLRAVFIIFVVWGHLLTSMIGDYNSLRSIYIFLFFFHMPAMAFISGYFSKNLEKIRTGAFVTVLMPYLILNVFEYLYEIFVLGESRSGYRFFKPYWGLWYLLALFLWKFFLKDLIRIRFILPLSFIAAILSGLSKEFSDYMALGRTICFLPFFLLGYYCTAKHIEKVRRLPKLLSIAAIICTAALSVYLAAHRWFKIENLYLRRPYPADAQKAGMLYRLLVYIIAVVMIVAIANLMTTKKLYLSYIGTSTMTIYVLHLFTIPLLEKLELFKNQPYYYLIFTIIMTAIISYIYSLPVVKKVYDFIIDGITGLIMKKENTR